MAIELVTGHSGAAHVSGADAGAMHAGICGSDSYVLGAVPSVTMSDANTLTIQPCDLMVEGRHVRLSGTNTLSIRSGAQTGKRNDLVYVRYTYDSSTGTESAKLGVKEGTTATTATDPALDNPSSVLDGATIADVAIARVSLDALTPTATWLLPQLPTLKALGDSVSQATKTERLYDGGGWHIWHMGKLVMVCASGVVIHGGGSWDSAKCPYTIPSGLRPPDNISTGGMSRDGALSTVLFVESGGAISISNMGGTGKANVSRYASLTYMAG
ncbi:hypothetical protein ACTQ1D_04045 [Parafannyhessea umbonata]|uniref:hypothetical protein n=1 Tax=Parafannyhessea umbonata TaxID=604330 RepID=UPI003F958D21